MKKFLNVIIVILILIAVPLCSLRVMGYKPYSVKSDSMSPTYEVNDMVYIKQTAFENIKVDDVITFINANNNVVTHRVVEIDAEAGCVYTQGDKNLFPDLLPVYAENILGVVQFSIPHLGVISFNK